MILANSNNPTGPWAAAQQKIGFKHGNNSTAALALTERARRGEVAANRRVRHSSRELNRRVLATPVATEGLTVGENEGPMVSRLRVLSSPR